MDLPEPTVLRKHKKPAEYLGEQETSQYNGINETNLMYKQVYFNAIDTIIAFLKARFDQPGLKACQSLEKLLNGVNHGREYQDSLNSREYQDSLSDALSIYHLSCYSNQVGS